MTAANIDQQFDVIRATINNIREDTRLKSMQGNTEQYKGCVQMYVSDQWHKMNDLEVKYKNNEIGVMQAKVGLDKITTALRELDVPAAKAMANSWDNPYGYNVRPYLGDAGSILGTASRIGTLAGRASR